MSICQIGSYNEKTRCIQLQRLSMACFSVYLRFRFPFSFTFPWGRLAELFVCLDSFNTSFVYHVSIWIFVYNRKCEIISERGNSMDGIKGYISIREASCRWGVSERRVNQYCAEGRISDVSRFGRLRAICRCL